MQVPTGLFTGLYRAAIVSIYLSIIWLRVGLTRGCCRFAGSVDKLADPTDVSKIVKQMNPKYLVYQFNVDYYEHMGTQA